MSWDRNLSLLLLLLAGCASSWANPERIVYSADETNRALAPLRPLQQRCYAGSASRREQRPVKLEFVLFVDEQGAVRSDPVDGYPSDPALLECLRAGLNELQFPAKGETDQIRVGVELTS
jgi:hypothetical protein